MHHHHHHRVTWHHTKHHISLFMPSITLSLSLSPSRLYQRATVLSQLVLSTFEPGQTIVKQGKQVSAFYIIKEGTVMVKRDGDTAALKELTAGQWFGESEVKLSQVSGANVIAKTQVQVFQLDRTSYMATFGQVETRAAASPSKAAAAGAGAGVEERKTGDSAAPRAAAGPRKRLGIPFAELEQRATLGTGTFGRVRVCSVYLCWQLCVVVVVVVGLSDIPLLLLLLVS